MARATTCREGEEAILDFSCLWSPHRAELKTTLSGESPIIEAHRETERTGDTRPKAEVFAQVKGAHVSSDFKASLKEGEMEIGTKLSSREG